MEIWTAALFGFFGSFHCVGMCGPIAMAIPRDSNRFTALSLNALMYNSGRILVYGVLGALFGWMGTRFSLSGFQSTLSILVGSVLLAALIIQYRVPKLSTQLPVYQAWSNFINRSYASIIKPNPSKTTLTGMGMLNGLLPCPFVYMGIAASILSPNLLHGMLYMILFGLGTFPAMFFMYMSPGLISMNLRSKISQWYPYVGMGLALLFILRGLALFNYEWSPLIGQQLDLFCVFPGTE